MVRCRGIAVRWRTSSSCRLSFRWLARPSRPTIAPRGAANSIASGKPSSLRQISTTSAVFASVSANSSRLAVTRSTKSCTAGKVIASAAVRFDDSCGLPRGSSRYSRSAVSPNRSQLSSTSTIRLSLSPVTRLWSGSSACMSRPSAVATALGTRRGSPRGARSTSQTPSSQPATICSATARASVVLPMPPGPTTVTRRCCERRDTSAAAASSRPIMRVTAKGRLCAAAATAGATGVACSAFSARTGETKL